MTQDGSLAEPSEGIWLQTAVQFKGFRFVFRYAPLPLDTLTQTSYITYMSGARARDFFFAYAAHESLLSASPYAIANPFVAR